MRKKNLKPKMIFIFTIDEKNTKIQIIDYTISIISFSFYIGSSSNKILIRVRTMFLGDENLEIFRSWRARVPRVVI